MTTYVGSRVVGGEKDRWATPEWLVEWVRLGLGWAPFDFDPCAAPETSKATDFVSEQTGDGLAIAWRGPNVWLNPPYSRQGHWLAKSARESRDNGLRIAALVLPSFDAAYWRPTVWQCASEVWLLEGRIAFERNGLPVTGSTNKSCLVVFDRERPRTVNDEPLVRYLCPPYPPRLPRYLCR